MDTQIETLSVDWSARNQLDAAHNKRQQWRQKRAEHLEKATFTVAINTAAQKVDVSLPQEKRLPPLGVDSKALATQLLFSQMLMASALYWPQFAMSVAKQDMASSTRPPARVENALASYRAISSVSETESGASLAATA
jgi:hypothetical protein